MTRDLAIVTGGGSGIGQALAWRLAARGLETLIVGRRREALDETCARAEDLVRAVTADVATEEGRARIAEAVGDRSVRILVHNAGVLEPIGPLTGLDPASWRRSQAVNVEAPLFLTQALLPRLRGGGRVLHVSSGAAHHAYPGWGAYCTAKAALHMLYQVWREELEPRDVVVGSMRPGVVDTPMQELIRQQSEERFPHVERFLQLKAEGMLRPPEDVADFMAWLLLDTAPTQFAAHEWDIGDPAHAAAWQRSSS